MTASFYIVRINSNKSVPATDYRRFLAEIEATGIGKWDTDHINIGDYQAFIWGEDAKTAVVHIYRVERIEDRHQNTEGNMGYKEATFLSADHPYLKSMAWPKLRAILGYKDNYVPRGNSRVKSDKMWKL